MHIMHGSILPQMFDHWAELVVFSPSSKVFDWCELLMDRFPFNKKFAVLLTVNPILLFLNGPP